MDKTFLDKVYRAGTPEQVRDLYDDWAESYEAELTRNGYVTPHRIAAALESARIDRTAPVLDFGCGTGLSGVALAARGFSCIDGCDLSNGMLAGARSKAVYRTLWQIDAGGEFPFDLAAYSAIVAAGVISTGAAPPETLDKLLNGAARGASLIFSFNDHTLNDPAYMDRLAEVLALGKAVERFREHGDHIPGTGLQACIFVLERT